MKRSLASLLPYVSAAAILAGTIQFASAATDNWIGTDNGNWSDPNNWTGGNAPPQPWDSLIFTSSSTTTTLNNDLSPGRAYDGLTFSGATFTLNGSGIILSGSSNANTIAILNTSGAAQTIGTMPLTLDWGYYTFASPSGGGIALNGGLSLNTGGVAYFDSLVTSSSLANDSSGLISGLGGAGLMYSGSTFTGLAAMSGTSIAAYSAWPSVLSGGGVIGATTPGAAVNIEVTDTATANYTLANGTGITYANTIFLSAASANLVTVGSTAGAQTLDLGAVSGIGGVYLPAGVTASAVKIGSGASTILTAGPETGPATPGTIVFAINGTSSANQGNMNSTIQDNLSGGAVTVVKTGPGSMFSGSTLVNSYSGGTYILQGQYQGGLNAGSFGTGPIYIAPSGSVYFNNAAGAITNTIYLSPGVGAGTAAATANGGGLIWGSSANLDTTFSGTLHLLGTPVTTGPACRISTLATSKNLLLAGQITGAGTLELYQGGHSGNVILSNVTANANNWTGGILVVPKSGLSVYLKLGANNQVPDGPGTGDMMLNNLGQAKDARFDLAGYSTTINALNSSPSGLVAQQELGNYTPSAGNSTLTMGANNADGAFYGVTSDAAGTRTLSLIKIGSGTQTFNGNAAFAYFGNTTVSNGTFALAGSGQIPNSPVITVKSGATLDVSGLSGGLTLGAAQTLNCVGTINGDTTINGTVKALDAIGTLTGTGSGNMTFNGGGTYVWYINDATGTAGSDPGWSWLNIAGTLTLNASGQFTINVNSLTSPGDAPGNALHFNPANSYSWRIATAANGISGYTGPAQFNVVHSAFSNYAGGSWNVSVSGNDLMLNYSPFNPIISLTPSTLTINQGQTAVYTAVANPLGTGTTFTWVQGSTTLTPPSGTSVGGGTYSIATSANGYTNTLTISGVDSPPNWPNATDTSTIVATVNDTYSASPQVGSLSATLTVIDPPLPPATVTPSFATPPVNAGAADVLTGTASGGTQPFTYQWYRNGTPVSGATQSSFNVNISPATLGSYTLVICNQAGCITSSPPIDITGPVTVVPNQIIYEPFNYDLNTGPNPYTWTAPGVLQVYNQATGVGLTWNTVGNNDFGTRAGPIDTYEGFTWLTTPPGAGSRPLITDQYPVEGLAGDSPHIVYVTTDRNGGQENLHFGTGGAITNGKVYVSFVLQLLGFDANGASGNHIDYVCGLGTGDANSTTHSVGVYVYQPLPANTWPNIGYTLGVFKGNLTASQLNPGVNGDWAPGNPSVYPGDHTAFLDYDIQLVVLRYNIDPGGHSTCDLWVNPDRSFFYTNEANLPAPTVANVASGVADQAGDISLFWAKATTYPVSRNFLDLRVGTTWASVTPPAAPTLSLANNLIHPTDTLAVLASQNAGNPVNSGATAGSPPYQWQFNGGAPLSDGPTGHGSIIAGSATDTLFITNPAPADLGTYTLTEINTSPSEYDVGIPNAGYTGPGLTYTNSVSAILTTSRPRLSVAASAGNARVSWPVNWAAALEATTSLVAPISWAAVSGGESSFLYWPPGSGVLSWAPMSPLTISGMDYTVTVTPGSTNQMFFRLFPSP